MSLINKGLDLTRMYEEDCQKDFSLMKQTLSLLMDEEALKEGGKRHLLIKPEDWSIQELFHFCEAVDVTQFPNLTATLMEKKIMDAFEMEAKVGDQLVDPFTSKLQISKIPGGNTSGTLHDVLPGMPYTHSGDIQEKFVQIEGIKRGEILDVTWEAVYFDQTGIVLRQAQQFGEKAAIDREKRIIYTILDTTISGVNYYAWYPSVSGTATRTAIWSAAVAGGPHLQNNIIENHLQDWTDLDAGYKTLGLMQDDNGDPIMVRPNALLVPVSLETIAKRLVNSSTLPANWARGVQGTAGEANPFANRFTVISSPLLDGVSTVEWYMGNFKKQFLEKIVIPLQVMTRPMNNTDDQWERDILASYKVRHYTQVGAVDYRYCLKSEGTFGTCETGSYCASWASA